MIFTKFVKGTDQPLKKKKQTVAVFKKIIILFLFSAFVCVCMQPCEDTLQELFLSSGSQVSNSGHWTSQETPLLTESPGWSAGRAYPLLLI